MAIKAAPKKMCLHCSKTFTLDAFYPNRAWTAEQGVDIYCKNCVKSMVHTKEQFRKYCWENNRVYTERIWELAQNKAMALMANNQTFINEKTSKTKRDEMFLASTIRQAFRMMNLVECYRFEDHSDSVGNPIPFNAQSLAGTLVQTEDGESTLDDTRKYYDAEWNGTYSKRELEYLNGYYQRLSESFMLDDVSAQDYARKVAKASLEADTRYELMRTGKATSKEWREAQDIFDQLSKSSAFNAAQRKDRGADANQALSEIIANIVINHQAEKPMVTFPPDDVDKILSDFRHTGDAIGDKGR